MCRFKRTWIIFFILYLSAEIFRDFGMSFYNQPAASCRFPCGLLTEFQSSDLEIDSNGRNESRIERVFRETKYYARLPNPAVAYEKKLEKQVKVLLRHFESLFPICAVLRDGQDIAKRGSGEWFLKSTNRNRKWRMIGWINKIRHERWRGKTSSRSRPFKAVYMKIFPYAGSYEKTEEKLRKSRLKKSSSCT